MAAENPTHGCLIIKYDGVARVVGLAWSSKTGEQTIAGHGPEEECSCCFAVNSELGVHVLDVLRSSHCPIRVWGRECPGGRNAVKVQPWYGSDQRRRVEPCGLRSQLRSSISSDCGAEGPCGIATTPTALRICFTPLIHGGLHVSQ